MELRANSALLRCGPHLRPLLTVVYEVVSCFQRGDFGMQVVAGKKGSEGYKSWYHPKINLHQPSGPNIRTDKLSFLSALYIFMACKDHILNFLVSV